MSIARSNKKLTPAECRQSVLDAWATDPKKFTGCELLQAGSRNVTYRCKMGHTRTTRRCYVLGTGVRDPAGCLECYQRTEAKTREEVEEAWSKSVVFDGYEFVSARADGSYGNWFFMYRCSRGHHREVMFFGKKISPCLQCYLNQAGLSAETIEERILTTWAANPKLFFGFELISCGKWLERTTLIRCPRGHTSKLIARKMVSELDVDYKSLPTIKRYHGNSNK